MIEFKTLNKRLLLEYISSDNFRNTPDIPITIHRAISQTKNPRIDEEDIILILAYENDNLIGYLGILPDIISLKDNSLNKIGWLSCLWVSQTARGKGISIQLIEKSLDLYENNILSADYVPFTKKVYDKTNQFLKSPYKKKGIRLYVKSDLLTILPPKKAFFANNKWLLKTFDYTTNTLINLRLKLFNQNFSELNIEYIDYIDDETNKFIKEQQSKQLFKRDIKDLNWIINNPWVLSAQNPNEQSKRYYFTSTAKSFNFYLLKIRDSSDKLIAFLMFAKRDSSLKLPYVYYNNCIDIVAKTINLHLLEWKIKTFTCFHSELSAKLNTSKTPAFLKKEIYRNYMVSSNFKKDVTSSEIVIQDGDGDCVFT